MLNDPVFSNNNEQYSLDRSGLHHWTKSLKKFDYSLLIVPFFYQVSFLTFYNFIREVFGPKNSLTTNNFSTLRTWNKSPGINMKKCLELNRHGCTLFIMLSSFDIGFKFVKTVEEMVKKHQMVARVSCHHYIHGACESLFEIQWQ